MIFILLIFLISLSFGSQLEELIKIALKNNIYLKTYKFRQEAFNYRSKFLLSLPNPEVRFIFRNFDTEVPVAREENPMSGYVFGISQKYILPIKRKLSSEIFKNKEIEVKRMKEIYEKELIEKLKINYYDYIFLHEKEKIIYEILEDLELLLEVAKANYSLGKGLLSDILMLKAEILRFKSELERINGRRKKIEKRIQYLVGKDVKLKYEALKLEPFPEGFYYDRNVYVRLKNEELNTLRKELERAKVEHLPDLKLFAEYSIRPGLPDLFSLGLSVSIPVWYKKREKLLVLETSEKIKAKRKEVEDIKLAVFKEFKGLEEEYKFFKNSLEKINSEIQTKEREVEALLLAYKYEETDIREVLRAYRILWALKIDRARIISELNKIVARAEALQ